MYMNRQNLKLDDSDLWELFRKGDKHAYSVLLNKYTRPLFHYAYRFNQDEEFLKDCIQDVFYQLWSRRENISATKSVKWYLFKAVRLRIFKENAKWHKDEELNEDYDFLVGFNVESELISELEYQDQVVKIKSIINSLPARQREILYLRFYDNLDFDSIAEIMGLTRQSVHNLLQRAYKSFRSEWLVILLSVFIDLKISV